MKKIGIIALILVIALSVCACGRSKPENIPTDTPTTLPVRPDTEPTLDTNIPDPDVNGNSDPEKGNKENGGTESGDSKNDSVTDSGAASDRITEEQERLPDRQFMDGQ